MRWIIELNPCELYNILSYIILALSIIFIAIFFITKSNIKIFHKLAVFSEKHKKFLSYLALIILIVLFISFGILKYYVYYLDKATKVKVDEKILIIEIDDYWNIAKDGAGPYFEKYGYTMKDYKEVSDILDKHKAVASLGVTPFIFVEGLRQNFPLSEDKEMINYLKELDRKGYELAMHGYNHCRNSYYCPQYEEVWYNVLTGKRQLETIFKKEFITYFPPGNQWTTPQYENVKKVGFKVIGNTHVPQAYFDKDVIITQKGYDPIYVYKWYARDFKHTSYKEWIQEYEKNNLFILQLHCNTFDNREKLEDLDKFLGYVKKDGAKIMTYKEFYKYMQDKINNQNKALTGNIIIKN